MNPGAIKALTVGLGRKSYPLLPYWGNREAIWIKQPLSRVILCLFVISCLQFYQGGALSYGDDSQRSGPESLLDKYHELAKTLENSSSPVPFYIESSENKNGSYSDIYGTINYPFEMVQHELIVPANWCDFLLPHPNVRTCTYETANGTWLLNVYYVIKSSQPLDDAYQMKFLYRISALQSSYFDIALTAHEGPFHTREHQLGIEAIPIEKNKTFIHLRYSFSYSALGYFFLRLKFGGSEIGFSTVGTDSSGSPVYAAGLRGQVERDLVFDYLAIVAYLGTLNAPSDQRFERRIGQWYDLTANFKKQFFQMKKEDYFTDKSEDRQNQQRLQCALNNQEIYSRVNICLRGIHSSH